MTRRLRPIVNDVRTALEIRAARVLIHSQPGDKKMRIASMKVGSRLALGFGLVLLMLGLCLVKRSNQRHFLRAN